MKISRSDIVNVIELLEYTGKPKVILTLRRYDLTAYRLRNGWKITFKGKK